MSVSASPNMSDFVQSTTLAAISVMEGVGNTTLVSAAGAITTSFAAFAPVELSPVVQEPGMEMEEQSDAECQLLGKFGSFGWWVQGFLFVACFLSLVYKRFTDEVRRPWMIWGMDITKQGVAMCSQHLVNIGVSKLFGGEESDGGSDPCSWYWVIFTCDTTFGVCFLFLLTQAAKGFYNCIGRPELARFGDYGNPPSWSLWRRQLIDFQVIVMTGKAALVGLMVSYQGGLEALANLISSIFRGHPQAKLIFVMVLTPILLNIMQFWVVDNILLGKKFAPIQDDEKPQPKSRWEMPQSVAEGHDLVDYESWKKARSRGRRAEDEECILGKGAAGV
mmetsp:Transcript_10820/g.23925  ORF Transcript_10820/g.23925 Transcript_10820/m.23925 type:complete len:334 (-) Transcript_10820:267-1268(-)